MVDVCFVTHVKWIDVAWRRPSKCGLIPSPPRRNNEDKRLLLNLSKKQAETGREREKEPLKNFLRNDGKPSATVVKVPFVPLLMTPDHIFSL